MRALLPLLSLCALGCGAAETGRGGGFPPVTVEAVRIEPAPFTDVMKLVGQLESEESVDVRSEIAGVIERIAFEEGQAVDAGDVLFELRDEEQRATLHQAEALLELAKDVHTRTQELAGRNVSALADLDRSTSELEVARATVELARVQLDRTEIRAPFGAVVGARYVSPGDRVDSDTRLVQIDKVDRLRLSFTLPEAAVGLASIGLSVALAVAPYPGEPFTGEVYFVSPTLDPDTRRLLLKAWVANPAGRLRPGLFATLRLQVEHLDSALLLPESAIVYDAQGPHVWRIGQGDVVERTGVVLGPRRDARVVIRQGLRPGDRVVTAGTHKLQPGASVRVSAPEDERPESDAVAADAENRA